MFPTSLFLQWDLDGPFCCPFPHSNRRKVSRGTTLKYSLAVKPQSLPSHFPEWQVSWIAHLNRSIWHSPGGFSVTLQLNCPGSWERTLTSKSNRWILQRKGTQVPRQFQQKGISRRWQIYLDLLIFHPSENHLFSIKRKCLRELWVLSTQMCNLKRTEASPRCHFWVGSILGKRNGLRWTTIKTRTAGVSNQHLCNGTPLLTAQKGTLKMNRWKERKQNCAARGWSAELGLFRMWIAPIYFCSLWSNCAPRIQGFIDRWC